MTALQAVGGGLPLALHIPHVVEQAGSLAGFAAVIGLAVLSALYFSQARDLRRLREWAGRAPERAAEGQPGGPVPGRVMAVPQRAPVQAQPQPKPATNGDSAPSVTAAPAGAAAGAAAGTAAAQAGQAAKPGEGQAAQTGDGAKPGEEGSTAGAEAADASAPAEDGQQREAAKPGMPAPASAAAAAGAGAASVAGPAAPGAAKPEGQAASPAPTGTESAAGQAAGSAAAGAAGSGQAAGSAAARAAGAGAAGAGAPPRTAAQPQRPPGSVLPPRTGTLPPVRRLPSSNVGAGPAQTGVLGSAPQQEKKRRNPVYIVLAVAGVLIIGAAAAIGVPAIVNGSKSDSNKTSSKTGGHTSTAARHKAVPVAPSKITVAVLNGTSISGLAATIGDRVEADGFTKGTISNASLTGGQRATSVVMYAPGHHSDAVRVAHRLGISQVDPVDSNSRQIAGDATVVVLVGSDKTQ
jgi:LytR cell envelope-related transcriptional attenuator